MALQVQDRDPKLDAMAVHWPKIGALLGGTTAMRAAKATYLPKQPNESDADYEYRLSTSTLFPAFERTCGVMAGKPFAKELVLNEVPAAIEAYLGDVDGEGRSLHAFASDVFDVSAIKYGFGGILVDYTRTEGQAKTLADEKAMGARPYMVHVRHDQILGYKAKRVGDKIAFTQLRLKETKEEDDGYGAKVVNCVRVLEIGKWELWVERSNQSKTAYVLEEEGATTLPYIPFAPIYGVRKGLMHGVPPLLALADLNIKHWQHQSDQDDSARFARKRLLVFTGLTSDDKITIASDMALRLPNGADAKVVQGSAESVTVGRAELQALQEQMIQTGAELLVATPGQRTATEASNDAEANKSLLQRIVENFEDALDLALQYMADWVKAGEGGSVSLFKDFAAGSLSDASAQLVVTMAQGGLITKETALKEQQRRGVLSPDLDVATEAALAKEVEPALGLTGVE
nr:MAG TPA: portal [Caudoviricetes sp.]